MTYQRLIATLAALLLLAACGPADDNGDNGDNGDDPSADAPGEVVSSALERDTDPDVDDETFAALTADNRDFAFDLLDQIRGDEEEENAFVSPHSISIALAMIYAGAKNETRDQMAEALRFQLDDDELHPAFNRLDLELDRRSEVELEEDQQLDLDIVNQTWGHEDFDFVDEYLDLLATQYGASQRLVDFINDYEPVRQAINEWVAAQTNDRIEDLLPEDSLSDTTRFVLVNAIYFYGTWADTFDEDMTRDGEFTLLDDSTVDVEMMNEDRSLDALYDPEGETTAVSLPYAGEEMSMILLKPSSAEDGFLGWEEQFDREHFDEVVGSMESQRLMFSMPKFKDEADYEMSEIFEEMGMVDAFDDCDADFEGVTGHPPCLDFLSLYIDEIYHQTFVEVDEEGTEAAGATGVVGDTPTSAPPSVDFNRPFYYAIYDHPTDSILFLGRMVDPS